MIFIYNAQDGHTYHSLIHTKEIHRHCSTVSSARKVGIVKGCHVGLLLFATVSSIRKKRFAAVCFFFFAIDAQWMFLSKQFQPTFASVPVNSDSVMGGTLHNTLEWVTDPWYGMIPWGYGITEMINSNRQSYFLPLSLPPFKTHILLIAFNGSKSLLRAATSG